MGSRSNILVKSGKETVVFYSHWAGPGIYNVARKALALKERWDDYQYLNAIIARKLFAEYDPTLDDTTGLGITQRIHDNGYDVLVVNVDKQTVHLEGYDWESHKLNGVKKNLMSFKEFVDSGFPEYTDE